MLCMQSETSTYGRYLGSYTAPKTLQGVSEPLKLVSKATKHHQPFWTLFSHQLASLGAWTPRRVPSETAPLAGGTSNEWLQVRKASFGKGPLPKFRGGKLKVSTAFKERFKLMAGGEIKMHRPGFRHRRSRKEHSQRLRLRSPKIMHHTYANTMKRLGFK